jgi:hypothetical protein
MNLTRETCQMLREYEALFCKKKYPYNTELRLIHKALRPSLNDLRKEFIKVCPDPKEVTAEVYLYLDYLYRKYDKTRSSLVPFFIKYTFLLVSKYIKRVERKNKQDFLLTEPQKEYKIYEEYYLSIPNILLDDKYICKELDRGSKYIIYKILISDNNNISSRELAKETHMSRDKITKKIYDIRQILKNGGF